MVELASRHPKRLECRALMIEGIRRAQPVLQVHKVDKYVVYSPGFSFTFSSFSKVSDQSGGKKRSSSLCVCVCVCVCVRERERERERERMFEQCHLDDNLSCQY